jgi:hypothetical protein
MLAKSKIVNSESETLALIAARFHTVSDSSRIAPAHFRSRMVVHGEHRGHL